jgi:hypothetical protein
METGTSRVKRGMAEMQKGQPCEQPHPLHGYPKALVQEPLRL